ncbi:MAG: SusD/RagB family nutrient-binding outer membrane lipoprotein [Bacteroidota bacterium]
MKNNFIKRSLGILTLCLLLSTACENGFDELNQNPNAPADAPAAFVLPGALVDLSYRVDYQMPINYIGLWVQQHASGAYPEEDQYSPRLNDLDVYWNNLYDNSMKDFRHIIDKGTPNEVAVAKIMNAYGFMVLTDIWGDIPYSQALQAEKGDGFLTPTFDTQEAVYDGILQDLDDAVTSIDISSIDGFAEADLIYGGDMELRIKFANSLRLRAFMHLSEVAPEKAKAGVVAMLEKPLLSAHDESPAIHYSDVSGNRNPISSRFSGRPNDFRASKSMVDRLIGSGDATNPADPRTEVYVQRNIDGIFVGVPNGVNGLGDVGLDNATSCKFGTSFLAADAAAYFMTYTEVEFIRAEAAIRGWIADDAQTAYEAAIRASMSQHGITDETAINTFLADANVAYDASKALQLVSEQKWIALFGQALESWTNFRRTGYPELPIALNDQNNGVFPQRFMYPSVETATNGDNVAAATQNQGGAELGDKLWWDAD